MSRNPTNIRNLVSKEKKEFAKQLRKEMTPAEERLWSKRSLINGKMRRQAVILGWIVDFYIPRSFLAIEIDGSVHDKQKEEDKLRDNTLLTKRRILVLRFSNEKVFADIDSVINKINQAL